MTSAEAGGILREAAILMQKIRVAAYSFTGQQPDNKDVMENAPEDKTMRALWPAAMCLQHIAKHALLFFEHGENMRAGSILPVGKTGLAYIKTPQSDGFVALILGEQQPVVFAPTLTKF